MDTASPFGDPDSEIGQPHQAGTSSSRSRRDSINSTTNSSAPNSPPAALAFSGSVAAAGKAQSSKDGHRPGRLGRAWSGTGDGEEDADFSKSRSASAQALGLGLGDATAAASPFRDAHQNAATRADQRGRAEHLDDDMTGSSSRAGPRGATSRGAAREDDDEAPPPSIMLDIDERSPSRRPAGPSGTYARSPPTHSHFSGISSTFANAGKGVRQSTTRGGGSVSVRLEGLRRSREAGVRAARVDEGEQSYSDDMDDGDSDEESRLMGLDGGSEARRSRADGQSSRHGARAAGGFGRLPDLAAGLVKRGARAARDEAADISRGAAVGGLSPRERALWKWANVENVDAFLQEVYAYYIGKGIFCIALSRVLNLVTIAFVIGFSTFLLGCVDYSQIRHDGQLSDVIVGHCVSRFSGLTLALFVTFAAFYGWQVVRFGFGLSRLFDMYHFYTHLLNIPDADVQTISWHEVVNRISALREENPVTSLSSTNARVGGANPRKLDAHDVANRIMRQENYLIALFNKDVLDLTVPVIGLRTRRPVLTKTLEWNLNFCLLGFLFDQRGQVRRQFVTDRHRAELVEGLKRRFLFMAIVNAIFAPFIVLYLLMYSFFRYFEEYHKNPSNIGSRQYTQFARWKFREFNELPHLFRRRCHNSYPFAQRYIDQFPKERIAIVARFVAFVAGSFAGVLLLASVVDPDLFLHFNITPQRNVLFYIGLFGTILAVARAMVPDDHQIFEPELLLRAVIEHTHYLPDHWKGKLHSAEVHQDFGTLYTLKVFIFLNEIMSVIITPFILWRSLPKSAPAIVDFFREFTVHVDELGYVCSFAVFNFARNGNVKFGAPADAQNERMASKEGKMEQSFLNFKASHPDWMPSDPSGSLFLSRMTEVGVGVRGRQGGTSDPNGATTARGTSTSGGGGGDAVQSSTLATSIAAKSAFYDEAFARSISLAHGKNAAALAASANKSGPRSHARAAGVGVGLGAGNALGGRGRNGGHAMLEAVDESDSALDLDSYAYADTDGRVVMAGTPLLEGQEQEQQGPDGMTHGHVAADGGVRDLLTHIYGGRGTIPGRW